MIEYKTIQKENFGELRTLVAREREDVALQGEALADARSLRRFAQEMGMSDEVVEMYLEEALVFQHGFMKDKEDISSLDGMKAAVEGAKLYIDENGLEKWQSRVARFLGRVADYEKNYQEAVKQYQIATDRVTEDPGYMANPAMVLEYKGFLALSLIRLGELERGVDLVEELSSEYDGDEIGQALKSKDYTTWAIWKSGLLINLAKTLMEAGGVEKYRELVLRGLSESEKILVVPEGVEVWSDFGFRKQELTEVKKQLGM